MTTQTGTAATLDDLRLKRRALRSEVNRVQHWRRLIKARIDLSVAGALLPDRLGVDAWDVLGPGALLPDHVRMAQLVRGSGSASAVLDLPELRDIDRHLAAYGAQARSELERVTSALVELLSQELSEERAGR